MWLPFLFTVNDWFWVRPPPGGGGGPKMGKKIQNIPQGKLALQAKLAPHLFLRHNGKLAPYLFFMVRTCNVGPLEVGPWPGQALLAGATFPCGT